MIQNEKESNVGGLAGLNKCGYFLPRCNHLFLLDMDLRLAAFAPTECLQLSLRLFILLAGDIGEPAPPVLGVILVTESKKLFLIFAFSGVKKTFSGMELSASFASISLDIEE